MATAPEAGSASVGGASSVDGAMLTGTASVTAGGDGAEEASIASGKKGEHVEVKLRSWARSGNR